MIHSYGETALLWFCHKRIYIRASAVAWDANGREWRFGNGEAPHFDGLQISPFNKHAFWSSDFIRTAEESFGQIRYYNQIRTCPICGASEVTWAGSRELYRENPKLAYNTASFFYPHIFSPCKNSKHCHVYSQFDRSEAIAGAVLADYPQENDTRTVEPSQIVSRLGISSYEDELWFGQIREQQKNNSILANKVVDVLLSNVWAPKVRRVEQCDLLPRPEQIVPKDYPLPSDSGVYFLYSGDRVIYVGQSGTANTRIKEHRRTGKSFDSVAFVSVEDPAKRLSVERHYINALSPELNKA